VAAWVPNAPSGPGTGLVAVSYAFSAVATYLGDDSAELAFEWGDGNASDSSGWLPKGTAVTDSHAYSRPGTYSVRIIVQRQNGAVSDSSTPLVVVIGTEGLAGTIIWRCSTQSTYSSPAVAPNGTVYVGSVKTGINVVHADGSPGGAWSRAFIGSSPLLADDGHVYCEGSPVLGYSLFKAGADGGLVAEYHEVNVLGPEPGSSPAMDSRATLVAGFRDTCVFAFSPGPESIWSFATRGVTNSSPAVGLDGTFYVGSADSCIYALDTTGAAKWNFRTGGAVYSSPAIGSDGAIYVGSDDGYLYALRTDGSLAWRCQVSVPSTGARSSPAIGPDGTVYIGTMDSALCAITSAGALKWRFPVAGAVVSSPAITSDGTIYIGARELYAVGDDGTLRWSFQTDAQIASSPAVGPDGTVYVAAWHSYLYAVKGTAPLASSAWPMFHHDLRHTGQAGAH
jgi:outer membrane protein assembly factor BamB